MIVEFEKVNAPGHRAVAGFYYYSGLCNHATVQAQRLKLFKPDSDCPSTIVLYACVTSQGDRCSGRPSTSNPLREILFHISMKTWTWIRRL